MSDIRKVCLAARMDHAECPDDASEAGEAEDALRDEWRKHPVRRSGSSWNSGLGWPPTREVASVEPIRTGEGALPSVGMCEEVSVQSFRWNCSVRSSDSSGLALICTDQPLRPFATVRPA